MYIYTDLENYKYSVMYRNIKKKNYCTFKFIFLWFIFFLYRVNCLEVPLDFDSSLGWESCFGFSNIWNQGSCSACCPMATSSVLSARNCMKNNINLLFSPQQIWDCAGVSSSANCNTGLYLSKMINAMGTSGYFSKMLLPSQCSKYNNLWEPNISRCVDRYSSCFLNSSDQINYQNSNGIFWFPNTVVKGYTSFTNEIFSANKDFSSVVAMQSLMSEIYLNGPVIGVLSLSNLDFQIFSSIPKDPLYIFQPNASLVSEVYHCVMVYGWGEDAFSGRKYWLIQNSYGQEWGNQGKAKITRGQNFLEYEWKSLTSSFYRADTVNDCLQNSSNVKKQYCIYKNWSISKNYNSPMGVQISDNISSLLLFQNTQTYLKWSEYISKDGIIWFSTSDMTYWEHLQLYAHKNSFGSNLNIVILTFTAAFVVGIMIFNMLRKYYELNVKSTHNFNFSTRGYDKRIISFRTKNGSIIHL